MFRLTGMEITQVALLSGAAGLVGSFKLGLLVALVTTMIFFVQSSFSGMPILAQKWHNVLSNLKSLWKFGSTNTRDHLQKWNSKKDYLKSFRANYITNFLFSKSRSFLLSSLDQDNNVIGKCQDVVKNIVSTIQSELTTMKINIEIEETLVLYLIRKLNFLVGCEYAVAEIAELMVKADRAIQDYQATYDGDISGLTALNLIQKMGIGL